MKPDQIEDIYELSPMQRGMLIHSQYTSDSVMYFVQWTGEMQGELNVETFTQAWQTILVVGSVLSAILMLSTLTESKRRLWHQGFSRLWDAAVRRQPKASALAKEALRGEV